MITRFRSLLHVGLFILIATSAQSQKGDYYLTHHNPPPELADNLNFSVLQDSNGIIWIANRKGILQYDGRTWRLIQTPSAIFSISLSDDNEVYAGGRNIIGKITRDTSNRIGFKVLAESDSIDDIISSIAFKGQMLFLTESRLFATDLQDSSQQVVNVEASVAGSTLQGLFEYQDQLLISTDGDTTYSINAQLAASSSPTRLPGSGLRWLSSNQEHQASALIDNEGSIWIKKGDEFLAFTPDDDGYLADAVPEELLIINDTLMSISTLSGGVVFVNTAKNEVTEIVNFHTGLPDNQVYAMGIDMDQGVWVTHDYGFTRIAPLVPFRSYSFFPGLEGRILTVSRLGNTIYVGTNVGVFYLDEVEDYDEIEYYVKKAPRPTAQQDQVADAPKVTSGRSQESGRAQETPGAEGDDEEAGKKKKKGGIFGFLKKTNVDKQAVDPQTSEEDTSDEEQDKSQADEGQVQEKPKKGFLSRLFKGTTPNETQESPRVAWERKTKRELRSIRHYFRKIEDIPTKTDILIPVDDFIMAAGLAGAYEVREGQANQISEDPIRSAHYSKANEMLFLSTYDNVVNTYARFNGEWEDVNLLDGLEDYIFQITENGRNIWLSSADSVYRIEMVNAELIDAEVLQVNNPHFEQTYAVSQADRMYFVNSSGYFYYDPLTEGIVRDTLVQAAFGLPERYFVGSRNSLWLYNGKKWRVMGDGLMGSSFDFLNVFPEIRQLHFTDMADLFWIVTSKNQIYEITPPEDHKLSTRHGIYLKEIRNTGNLLLPQPRIEVLQDNSSLSFNFIQPEYTGLLGIEYRYRVAGLSFDWSEWSPSNNEIRFSYLPPADYSLEVEARDVFGNVSGIEPIAFRVIPPYWRQPWFYAGEVIFFAILLVLSIRLNRINTRYRFLSRLLAFLTLILIVEFIQTVAEYKFETDASPVIDFFIQVSIALLVLPFESILRRAMFKQDMFAAANVTTTTQEVTPAVGAEANGSGKGSKRKEAKAKQKKT